MRRWQYYKSYEADNFYIFTVINNSKSKLWTRSHYFLFSFFGTFRNFATTIPSYNFYHLTSDTLIEIFCEKLPDFVSCAKTNVTKPTRQVKCILGVFYLPLRKIASSFQGAPLMTPSIIKRSLNFHIWLDTPERLPFSLTTVINYANRNPASSSIYEGLILRVIFRNISARRTDNTRDGSRIAEFIVRLSSRSERFFDSPRTRCWNFGRAFAAQWNVKFYIL